MMNNSSSIPNTSIDTPIGTHIGKLFFQTPGAHILSGFFAWVAVIISSHQVYICLLFFYSNSTVHYTCFVPVISKFLRTNNYSSHTYCDSVLIF